MANTHKKLETVTVGAAGGVSSISFTSIPQTYTDLVIKLSSRSSNPYIDINFNGLATNFSSLYGYGNGSSVGGGTQAKFLGVGSSTSNTANTFGNLEVIIANYASSHYKSYSAYSAQETNAASAEMHTVAGLWSNTAAITSVQIYPEGSGTFAQYTTATLYGVFKADVSGAPSAPTSVTATAGNTTASVAFTPAGQTAGLFTVTSSPGSITGTGSASPITISGLTNDTSYTFTVTAANPLGVSAASSASSAVTPLVPKVGYFAGGTDSNKKSNIYALNMNTETTSTLSATLTTAREKMGSASNSGTAGYFAGGADDVTTYLRDVDKLAFATNTKTNLASKLGASGRSGNAGMANSGTAGYFAGGSNPSVRSDITKLAFSNDAATTLSATMTTGLDNAAGLANSGTAGYIGGGYNGAPGTLQRIEKFTFSDDTKSAASGFALPGRQHLTGFANSGTAGYWSGGEDNNPALINELVKTTFSNDARSQLSATLPATTYKQAAASLNGTAGYIAGGYSAGEYSNTIYKLLYSNETRSTLGATLAGVRASAGGLADSGTL